MPVKDNASPKSTVIVAPAIPGLFSMLMVISTVSPGFAVAEDTANVGTPSAITGKALNVVVNIIAIAVKRLRGLFKRFFIDNQDSIIL